MSVKQIMPKHRLNHNINEHTCLLRFHRVCPLLYHFLCASYIFIACTKCCSLGQAGWNGRKIGKCGLNNLMNKRVHQYCDLGCTLYIILLTLQHDSDGKCYQLTY